MLKFSKNNIENRGGWGELFNLRDVGFYAMFSKKECFPGRVSTFLQLVVATWPPRNNMKTIKSLIHPQVGNLRCRYVQLHVFFFLGISHW